MPWTDRWYAENEARVRIFRMYSVITIVMVVVGLIAYGWFRSSATADRSACSLHLRRLMQSIEMYKADYDGQYPPQENWAKALMPYTDSIGMLLCPSDPDIRPFSRKKKKGKKELPISYCYIPPLSADGDGSNIPVLFDRMYSNYLGNHENGGNVAYQDCHVQWRSINQWIDEGIPTVSLLKADKGKGNKK